MLIPTPNMNLKLNLLVVGGEILSVLAKIDEISMSKLLEHLKNIFGEDVSIVWIEALSFLFLLGKIEYVKDQDLIRVC